LAAKLEEEKKMKELSKITTYQGQGTQMGGTNTGNRGQMIEITLNDRLGKKVRVKAQYVLRRHCRHRPRLHALHYTTRD
jgi:hypothetical protein